MTHDGLLSPNIKPLHYLLFTDPPMFSLASSKILVVNMVSNPNFHRSRRALYTFLNLPHEIQFAIESGGSAVVVGSQAAAEVTTVASAEPQNAPVTASVVDAMPVPVDDATMSKIASASAPEPPLIVARAVVATNP